MSQIEQIHARQILDSRGNPTVEVEVALRSGARGLAAVPSGASTGEFEAVELRDGGEAWGGKGVGQAVANVNGEIAEALTGARAAEQGALDRTMIELDGTPNKGRLGANAILGVSLAAAKAAAADAEQPLYLYLAELYGGGEPAVLPVPMMNVLNGGAHADNSVDFQEFMIVPAGAGSFSECMRIGIEVFHALKKTLAEARPGDRGRRRGRLRARPALQRGGAGAGPRGGRGRRLRARARRLDRPRPGDQRDLRGRLLRARARGPHAERGGDGRLLGGGLRPLPDRLDRGRHGRGGLGRLEAAHRARSGTGCSWSATTSSSPTPSGSTRGIEAGVGNSILVKVNQIGTLTETLEAIRTAREAGYTAVISHRSGETEDTTIADLAVGTGAGQIKTGAPSRSDRVAKYNRLLRIEEELGSAATFPGLQAFAQRSG